MKQYFGRTTLGYAEREMPVIVSLLSGINVGGNRMIKMEALRELYESLGFKKVETFIQSGNVICMVSARELPKVRERIEEAIEETFGFPCDVMVRTTAELRETLARNPFAKRTGIDPAKLLINFLGADPDAKGCTEVLAIDTKPEELCIDGRHVYIYYANGLARPKLPWIKVAKMLGTSATGRNLSTVQKLLAIAERLEASR